jgi:hypothetical protein
VSKGGRDTQRDREILYPHYNVTRVREIISAYETDLNLVKQGENKVLICSGRK